MLMNELLKKLAPFSASVQAMVTHDWKSSTIDEDEKTFFEFVGDYHLHQTPLTEIITHPSMANDFLKFCEKWLFDELHSQIMQYQTDYYLSRDPRRLTLLQLSWTIYDNDEDTYRDYFWSFYIKSSMLDKLTTVFNVLKNNKFDGHKTISTKYYELIDDKEIEQFYNQDWKKYFEDHRNPKESIQIYCVMCEYTEYVRYINPCKFIDGDNIRCWSCSKLNTTIMQARHVGSSYKDYEKLPWYAENIQLKLLTTMPRDIQLKLKNRDTDIAECESLRWTKILNAYNKICYQPSDTSFIQPWSQICSQIKTVQFFRLNR
jgi:hypothetical protein